MCTYGTGSDDFDSLMNMESRYCIRNGQKKTLWDCELDEICLFAYRKDTDIETQDSKVLVCSNLFALLLFH